MTDRHKYFAMQDGEDLVNSAMQYLENWATMTGTASNGITAVWYRNLKSYFANLVSGTGYDSGLEFTGSQGELIKMLVPQARSLNQQFLSLTTKQKLHFEAMSEGTDAINMADARVANGLIKATVRDQKLDFKAYRMAEHTTLTGAGYMRVGWNSMKGKAISAAENGEIIYSGDLNIETLLPTDVVFDYTKEDFYNLDWVMVKTPVNRFDLIAKFPNMEDKIMMLPSIMKAADSMMFWYQQFTEDYVYLVDFFHRSSPALEKGRYTQFCGKDVILFDDFNPYKSDKGAFIPIVQMKPEPVIGTGFGYPFFSNILPLQEMLDHSFSAIASNQSAFAVQSILNPIGNDIGVKNIGGLRFLNYRPMNQQGGGKPEALQLTQSSPETFKFADMIKGHMMEIYNINGALRGQPPPGVTAGNAIATLTTNAIEFSQNFTKCYVDALETAMTYAVFNYYNFGDEEMLVSVEGPNKSTVSKQFKTSDLGQIKRVTCKIANPLMATSAGKFEIAQNLLQMGLIKDAKKYFDILEGAPAEVLWDDDYSQDAFIQQENDFLRENKPVMAMMTDLHAKHIACHSALINDAEIRQSSDILEAVTAHVQQHYQLLEQQDPRLAKIIETGKDPGPAPMGPPNMGGGMGPPPGMHPPGPPNGGPPKPPMGPAQMSQNGAPGQIIKQPGEASPAKPGVDLGRLSNLSPQPPGLK